jgi:hypothetical protein
MAAAGVARTAMINREVLARSIEAGDDYLRQLFSAAASPGPGYGPSQAQDPAPRPPGILLDRSA